MNDTRAQLAKNIEQFRIKRGLSKTDLAKDAGVSRPSISQYESGLRRPKMDAVRRIAAALRVSPAQLDPYGIYDHEVSAPLLAAEDGARYGSDDIFDRLAGWLRSGASDDGKKSILMTAQALGFQDRGLTGVLDALCEPAKSRAG